MIEELSSITDLPLCLNQEHLLLSREYFQHCGVPLSPSSVVTVLRLRGRLNDGAVEQALNGLVERHSALRTSVTPCDTFSTEQRSAELDSLDQNGVFQPGLFRQSVVSHASIELATSDLTTLPPSERDTEIQRLIAAEASRAFDYSQPPLMRGRLVRIQADEHLLVLSVDHLISDAWSMSIIRRDLSSFLTGDSGASLPRLLRDAAGYAVWQHGMGQARGFDTSVDYWQRQWREFSSSRIGFDDLPFCLPAPPDPTFRFASSSGAFSREESVTIRTFARKSRVTLYVLLLAAIARLLQRYTGMSVLGLWGHFANRLHLEIRDAVGWFTHTHLLGLDMAAHASARDLLLHCREVVARASEHQETPVMLVWRAMGAYPRDPDAKVLLDLSVAGDDLSHAKDPLGSLCVEHAPELTPVVGRFAGLGLYIRDNREFLELSVQYLKDRFPKAAMERLLVDFKIEVANLMGEANPGS